MSSAAIAYCLQKLKRANSDTQYFYNVGMVKAIGTKTPIAAIDPDIRCELFEKIDFLRLMQPDVVIDDEPPHVVQNVMLDLLMWFLQCPEFIVHEKVYQLLPLIAADVKDVHYDIKNDICEENIMESYRIFEILSESPIGMDNLIKAKVPNALCSPAGVMNGCSMAKKLLVLFASKRGKHIWYTGDIDGLESFLIKYVNWIKVQRDKNMAKELDMLRVILTSVDTKIHTLEAEDNWGIIVRDIVETFLYSKPCVEDRDMTLRLAIQAVRLFGLRFVLGAELKFLMHLVLLTSTEISVGLINVKNEGLLGKEDLLVDCSDFLDLVITNVYIETKEQKARIYSPIRRAVGAVLGFLKRLDQLDENQQEGEDVKAKPGGYKEALDGKTGHASLRADVDDERPRGTWCDNCPTCEGGKELPKTETNYQTEDENDNTVKIITGQLANVLLEKGCIDHKCNNQNVDKKDRNNSEHHSEQNEIRCGNRRTDDTRLFNKEMANSKTKPREKKKEITKDQISEKSILGDVEITKPLDVDIGKEIDYTDTDKMQIQEIRQTAGENTKENTMRDGQNKNHKSKVKQKETKGYRTDNIMRCNECGHRKKKNIDQQVENMKTISINAQKRSDEHISICDVQRFVIRSTPLLCRWILTSVQASSEEIIEFLPYLVNVIHCTLSHLHDDHQSLTTGPIKRHVVSTALEAVGTLILTRNEIVAILVREHLPGILEKYFNMKWITYSKTTRLIRNQTANPETQPSHQSKKRDRHVICEKDLEIERYVCQLQAVQEEQIYVLGKLLGVLILFISQDDNHVQTHDMYPRLCNFAVAKLPCLETSGENVIFTFCIMTMGIMLLQNLQCADKVPQDYRAVPFFESCVNLLSGVHQSFAHHCKRAQKGIISVTPRFQQLWDAMEDQWVHAMMALAGCMPIFPSLSQCILDADWIPAMLKMLKQVKAETEEDYVTYYGMVLTACALSNDECKGMIQEHNGLAIARKFNFDKLEEILK